MHLKTLTTGIALASLGSAQTPPGFTPAVTARLDLVFGTKVVTVPGTELTRAGRPTPFPPLMEGK